MSFAKLSSAFLVGRIAPQSRRSNLTLHGMIGFWIVYSLLAFAFQCGIPNPWKIDPHKCSQGVLLFSIIILNMITDIVLAVWIFPILRPLRRNKNQRATVAILFGSRGSEPFSMRSRSSVSSSTLSFLSFISSCLLCLDKRAVRILSSKHWLRTPAGGIIQVCAGVWDC